MEGEKKDKKHIRKEERRRIRKVKMKKTLLSEKPSLPPKEIGRK